MNQLICQKCGGVISNDFNHTLSFCTNCGASLNLAPDEKTLSLNESETLLSPAPRNYNAKTSRKGLHYLFGCLGLLGAAGVLSAIGFFGYWKWTNKNSAVSKNDGKIVSPKTQTMRFLAYEPKSLDPHLSPEPIISNTLFDGLAEYNNKNSDITPSLATGWESSADAIVWTFKLRKEAKWTDGKPITANDFVYSWRRALNPDLKNINAPMLYHIKNAELYHTKNAKAEDLGVRAIDDYTLQVTLERPTPLFIKTIADTVFRPVPQTAIEKFGENWTKPENIVTSGAFKLTEWSPKNQIVVERNPQFWNNAGTKLEKIVFISDEKIPAGSDVPEKSVKLYEKGETDALFVTSTPDESLKNKKDFSLIKTNGTEFLLLNTTIKPFNDVRARRAFSLAINREKLKEKNHSNFPTVSFVPEIKNYENAKNGGYNPDEARKLLSEAGYPQGQNFPAVEYIYNTSERNRDLAEFLQDQWRAELNVTVRLVNMEFKGFLQKRGALEYNGVARGGWFGDYDDPYTFLNFLYTDKNGGGTGWNDKKYAEMVEKANLETDQAKRYKMLSEAETYLLEEQPVIPLSVSANGFLCQPYVKNLSLNPLRQINWREVYID